MNKNINIEVRPACEKDLDNIENLYNDLNDYLAKPGQKNYPRWKKGVYPIREQAEEGFRNGQLYVAVLEDAVVGTVICLQEQEDAYQTVKWQIPMKAPVLVIHILAVHPDYFGYGVGAALLQYAEDLASRQNRRAVRLDTYQDNLPAARLFEKCGFHFCGMVDLGLEEVYGLKWYRAYEKVL